MTVTSQTPKEKWSIWLANVKYDDFNKMKKRPVLILNNNSFVIEGFKITTHKPRENYIGEYPIIKWKEAGLLEPSTIRLTKLVELRDNDFDYYLGKLQDEDIKNIKNLIIQLFDL